MAIGGNSPNSAIGPTGPMYIFDLLEYLKGRNYASWLQTITLIQTLRRYGTAVAKADMLDEATCLVRTHIGGGLEAIIEMELDRDGQWQPVIGQVVER